MAGTENSLMRILYVEDNAPVRGSDVGIAGSGRAPNRGVRER